MVIVLWTILYTSRRCKMISWGLNVTVVDSILILHIIIIYQNGPYTYTTSKVTIVTGSSVLHTVWGIQHASSAFTSLEGSTFLAFWAYFRCFCILKQCIILKKVQASSSQHGVCTNFCISTIFGFWDSTENNVLIFGVIGHFFCKFCHN